MCCFCLKANAVWYSHCCKTIFVRKKKVKRLFLHNFQYCLFFCSLPHLATCFYIPDFGFFVCSNITFLRQNWLFSAQFDLMIAKKTTMTTRQKQFSFGHESEVFTLEMRLRLQLEAFVTPYLSSG